jgi:dTDP-4-amino-4,6-dideoxygalactose transaminase
VIPVHLFGRCADMPAIGAAAARRGIAVVEDAAQAIGAGRAGRRAGGFGAAGCFSFYPSKNLAAAGDAGCVTTDDPELERRLRLLRSHGVGDDGSHLLAGTTSRLDALQAAVLLAKLPHLKAWTEARARNARIYAEELAGCAGIELPKASPGEEPVWNQYTLRCRRPGPVRAALAAAGIEWRHYYPRPVACEVGLGPSQRPRGEFPRAERACAEVVSVPVRPSLAPEDVREIAAVIRASADGERS